ncbi:MAG TPA: SDR family NAD(P)-dependent oxidoreductase [Saprospiraceae bacterium]|jgi:short-subunit dehydrogenase|nr:SDR family NAD(P)-dependent oxidoreductase [Saprospiraceae bacterium]
MQVKDKTVVITGGGNGMGREVVLNMLHKGARVAAVDVNGSALEETKRLAGTNADRLSIHVLDITDKDAVSAFPQIVIAEHGSVDIVINNAGIIQPFVRVNDLPYDKITRVFDVNFFGLLYMTKSFLPRLLERPEAHLVNVSSMGGFLPVPGQSVYGASKAAVKLLTEGLYAELRHTRVHVSIVFPGAIGTEITRNSGVDVPNMAAGVDAKKQAARTTSPDKAAEIIVNGILKNKNRIFVGGDASFLDRLYRLAPTFATNFIAGKMKDLLK